MQIDTYNIFCFSIRSRSKTQPLVWIKISPFPGGQDIVIEWFDSTVVPINHREIPNEWAGHIAYHSA